MVHFNKPLYGLKRGANTSYRLLSSIMVESGFEQRFVDPHVLLLRDTSDVVAMMVFHVDDVKIEASEEVTEVVVSAVDQSEISRQSRWIE